MEERPIKHEVKALDVKGLAEAFGCAESLAYQMMRSENFPSFKVGRKWFVGSAALEKWIDNGGTIS